MDLIACCPICSGRGVLIPLGVRYERPHRWRPWVIRSIPLYLCRHCDALVAARPMPAPTLVPFARIGLGPWARASATDGRVVDHMPDGP